MRGTPRWLGAVSRKIAANLRGTSQDARAFLFIQYIEKNKIKHRLKISLNIFGTATNFIVFQFETLRDKFYF